jgi:hypothetical protein
MLGFLIANLNFSKKQNFIVAMGSIFLYHYWVEGNIRNHIQLIRFFWAGRGHPKYILFVCMQGATLIHPSLKNYWKNWTPHAFFFIFVK